jgi:5-methylcytosine-specific restriction endonuclease McrA
MSRIRTIKPEFWTDDKVVQMPFPARLLFIGLWNFCDDDGYIVDEPESIRLQVLPNDPDVDVDSLLDLMWAMGLVDRLVDKDGRDLLRVANFERHQRISHKAKSRFLSGELYKKASISTPLRRALADKYGCLPGNEKDVECFSCGAPGRIYWHRLRNGRPSAWVTFSLEIDHATPETSGGQNVAENLILSCRYCNRSRGSKPLGEFLSGKFQSDPENTGALRPDLRKGREGKGEDSDPDGSGGGEPPSPAEDRPLIERVFGECLAEIARRGVSDRNARSFLGRLRKSHSDGAIVDAVARMVREDVVEPIGWLSKALANGRAAVEWDRLEDPDYQPPPSPERSAVDWDHIEDEEPTHEAE